MRIVNTVSVKLDCLKYFTLLRSNKTIQAVFHYYLDACLMHFTVPKREDNSSEFFPHMLLQLVTRYNLHPVSALGHVKPFLWSQCSFFIYELHSYYNQNERSWSWVQENCRNLCSTSPNTYKFLFPFSWEDWCLL